MDRHTAFATPIRWLLAASRQPVRFVLAGGTVALAYIGLGLLLPALLGVPLQTVIPVAYVLAALLHFGLQRWFVFRDPGGFELSLGEQALRYLPMGIWQYAWTAGMTALVPTVLGLPERAVYVAAVLSGSVGAFLFLRYRVFQSADDARG